jgi:hypothetical protein
MKKLLQIAALGLAVVAATAGSAVAQVYHHNRDGDDSRADRAYPYGNFQRGTQVARDIGYQDGARVAREDTWKRKPYNPNPRGPYAWADRGYRREFGNISEYREQYSEAYRQGYINAFGGYRANR